MSIDWTAVANGVQKGVAAIVSVVDVAAPEAAPIANIINEVVQGAVAAEPTAVALVQQLQSGTPPTPAQLQAVVASYTTDDDALNADIAAHIKALDAPPATA